MSEEQNVPAWVGERGFISAAEWDGLDRKAQAEWTNFTRDATWLLDQPQFRRFVFAFLNEPRFCGTDQSPRRQSVEDTFHAIGVQDAGRMLRLVLQAVAPRKWMHLLHDAFNAMSRTPEQEQLDRLSRKPPESGKE